MLFQVGQKQLRLSVTLGNKYSSQCKLGMVFKTLPLTQPEGLRLA